MNIIDLIDTFNSFLKHRRELNKMPNTLGFVVAHKTIEEMPNFKAYKKYTVRLYFNAKYIILGISETVNSSQISDEEVWDLITNKLSLQLFNIITTSKVDKLIDGTYGTDNN